MVYAIFFGFNVILAVFSILFLVQWERSKMARIWRISISKVSMWMELEYHFDSKADSATSTKSNEEKKSASTPKKSASTDYLKDQSMVMDYTPDPILPVDLDLKIELAVTLRAEFKKDGKVGKVEVISSRVPASMSAKMLDRLEKATAEAAGRIKFTPAIKDGHRVSQWYLLEYTFRRGNQQRYPNWRRALIA